MRRRGGARGGFSLLEIMFAVLILAVVWGGAVSSQILASDLVQTGRETAVASGDLQTCMERIWLENVEDLPRAGSAFAHGQPIEMFEGLHLQNERIVATYPGFVAGGAVPEPLPVVLTITWDDFKGRRRTLQLTSMRVR